MGAYLECLGGQGTPLLQGGLSFLVVQQLFQVGVFFFGGDDHHVFMVFSGSPDHRRATDIDLFNNGFIVRGGGQGLFKGV